MLYLEKIPYLKVYKQKITMPIDSKRSSLYSMIFLNSPDVDSSILTMKHSMIDTRSKYLSYYIERLYKEKIGVKTVNLRNIKEQELIYDKITEELKGFKCYKTFNSINLRNLYYDMSTYNNIFFTNNKIKNMKQKAYAYLSYMTKTIRQSKFDVYTHQTMVIDLDRWDKIDNPLMYMLIAYRYNYEALQSIGDIDILLCTNSAIIKFNPSKLTEKLYSTFKREINKVVKLSKSDMEKLSKELDDEKVSEVPNSSKPVSEEKPKAITSKPKEEDKIDKGLVKDTVPDVPEPEEDVDLNDKELLSDLIDAKMKEETTTKSAASIKRDKELREKQKQIKINNMTIEDYRKLKVDDVKIEDIDITDSVSTINPNATDIKFTNFEKTYNDNLMKKDTIDIITQLNNKSIPVYIKDIDIVDSSDELNYKDTYTITMEDENRVRHTIKVDMPKFVDDKFLYLGGNKKIIIKQLFSLPIVKTDSNEVVITTNYNKTFISRTGLKVSPKIERLKRTLANDKSDMVLVRGNNATDNNSFKTNLEYDELALLYTNIKSKNIDICLNQKSIQDRLKVNVEEGKFCIGFYKDGTPILCDFETEKIGDLDLVDFIVANSSDKFKALYEETTPGGKRYMYTKSKIMNKNIPLVILLGYWEGLTKVMNKANIKHYFSDKRSKITDNQEAIQFEDGYLVYDKYPIENSLLMNALQTVHTKAYKYEDFDEKDVYLDIFENFYNTRYLANALDSFYEFMIDPITEEILDTMNYPTDIVSLFLFANSLLADNASMDENAMDQFRVRSNEVVNAILHKKIADAYGVYRKSASNNNPTKISIPQDAVIKELLTSKTVEEFSTLNPIYEADKTRAITRKGFNGMNLDDAYTEDKRMYNKSMLGVMGVSTSPDYNVGVVRKLSLEPNIKNARGFIDNPDNVKDIKDSNMFSPSELLTPNAVVHDDSVRTAMASKQSGHIIPVTKTSPVLISNGYEQSIQYSLSKDFIVYAEDDGVVSEVDNDAGIAIITYKNGKSQAIDFNPRVVKNSSSGFYLSNKLNCDLKKGQKVKKNEILAYENRFFTDDKINGNRFNIGSLQKVALNSSYSTFEDSTLITQKMAKDMSTNIIMMKDVIIGKNANVTHMVKVGDHVDVGDILINYESSYDDEDINSFLASIGDELQEDIVSLTHVPIKSKYSGTITDIKIYTDSEVEDMSPSLKKIVSSYFNKNKKKRAILNKYDKSPGVIKCGILANDPVGPIKPDKHDKIKGRVLHDSVLIEFYISYDDVMAIGDKITFFSALKCIIGEVIEEGYEPYSEYRPDEEISTFLGARSVNARMTPSVILTMFGNKVLVELKRHLKQIYES